MFKVETLALFAVAALLAGCGVVLVGGLSSAKGAGVTVVADGVATVSARLQRMCWE